MDNDTIVKYENEAQGAYVAILGILDLLASYKVSKPASATLYLNTEIDTAASGLGAIVPTMQLVIAIKLMMSELKDKYAGIFVIQFQYLTAKDIDSYHCFSAVNLLESTKLIVSLNKTLKAMKDLILQIQKAKTNNFKKAAETAAWTAAWSSFFSQSPSISRVLDTTTSEKDAVTQIKTAIDETSLKVDKVLADTAYAQTHSLAASTSRTFNPNNEAIAGLEVVAAAAVGGPVAAVGVAAALLTAGVVAGATQAVAEQVNRFNLYLFSKQYPKGTPYCTPFRNKLNAQNLKNSREYSATAAESLSNESASQAGKASKGYGATFAETSEFKELLVSVNAEILAAATKYPGKYPDNGAMAKNQLNSLVQSIKASSTEASVKMYVIGIQVIYGKAQSQ